MSSHKKKASKTTRASTRGIGVPMNLLGPNTFHGGPSRKNLKSVRRNKR